MAQPLALVDAGPRHRRSGRAHQDHDRQGRDRAELQLFFYDCARQGVHPLDQLIHFTKRGGKYTPITSIDFMRQRAAQTGECAGIDDAVFIGRRRSARLRRDRHRLSPGAGPALRLYRDGPLEEYKPDANDFMWRKMPTSCSASAPKRSRCAKAFRSSSPGSMRPRSSTRPSLERASPSPAWRARFSRRSASASLRSRSVTAGARPTCRRACSRPSASGARPTFGASSTTRRPGLRAAAGATADAGAGGDPAVLRGTAMTAQVIPRRFALKLLLLSAGLLGCDHNITVVTPTEPDSLPGPVPDRIEFRVIGTYRDVSVRHVNAADGTVQTQTDLPYLASFTTTRDSMFLSLTASSRLAKAAAFSRARFS